MVVRMRLTTIEVPIGTASGSEEIWSYLDEERVRANRSAALGRNGLRIGVTSLQNWPELTRILQKMTGQKLETQDLLVLPGKPFQVQVKQAQPEQTIHTCYADRTISMADYPAGDYVLALKYTLNEEDSTRFTMTGVPQILSSSRTTSVVNEGLPMIVSKPTTFTFLPMTFQLNLQPNELVVIGPGAESRRPSSIGHQFLVDSRQDMQFETILILMPEVVKATMKEQPFNVPGQP